VINNGITHKMVLYRPMGIYEKYLLPKLVHFTCGQIPTMRQREKVVPLATGRVLEIGIGSGLNIPFYDAQKVTHLWGLDPSAEMWTIAQKNAEEHHLDAEFIQSGAESIPLDNNSADTVLLTYTLCTIPNVHAALDEIKRVLKPTGKLIFCEHGKAPDESVQRWQNRVNPVWKKFAGGCNLNRAVPELLEQSGFRSSDMRTMYLPGWRPATFNYWGTASY
jgi:ubiquinone/menaquinone biosynthesis C-methylase UbiE